VKGTLVNQPDVPRLLVSQGAKSVAYRENKIENQAVCVFRTAGSGSRIGPGDEVSRLALWRSENRLYTHRLRSIGV